MLDDTAASASVIYVCIVSENNKIEELRSRLAELTQQYLEDMTNGKRIHDLRPLNDEINRLALEIDQLESALHSTRSGSSRN